MSLYNEKKKIIARYFAFKSYLYVLKNIIATAIKKRLLVYVVYTLDTRKKTYHLYTIYWLCINKTR